MDDAEKPKESWQERWKRIVSRWQNRKIKPLIWLNIFCAWVDKKLKAIHFFDIVERLGHLAIIIAVIFYIKGCTERQRQAENQRKAKHFQAWQVINAAYGKPGNCGRIDALQDLVEDKVSLSGVNLANSNLRGIKIENADLSGANLTGADLKDADLTGSDLSGANLDGASLFGANLVGADLKDANLAGVQLWGADLTLIKSWKEVKSMKDANIFGVISPPAGFREWAKERGVVSIEDEEGWKKLIRIKMEERNRK